MAADSSEKLYQFKARTQAVLDQAGKLEVIASPGVDGIHLRALGKLKCGTAELLAKVCDDKHKKLLCYRTIKGVQKGL